MKLFIKITQLNTKARTTIKCLVTLLVIIFCSNINASTENFRIGGTIAASFEGRQQDTEIAFKLLFNEFISTINETSTMKVYQVFDTMWKDLQNKKLDSCFATPLELVDHLDTLHPNGFYSIARGENPFINYLLVTKKGSYTSLQELKDKRIAMIWNEAREKKLENEVHFDIGELYIDVELLKKSLPTHQKFFSEVIYEHNANAAIINLIFGKIDAVLINEHSLETTLKLNEGIRDQIYTISKSEGYLESVIAVRKDFPDDRLEKITNIVTTLHKTPKGKHLLKILHLDRIMAINKTDLSSVIDLRKQYETLINQ